MTLSKTVRDFNTWILDQGGVLHFVRPAPDEVERMTFKVRNIEGTVWFKEGSTRFDEACITSGLHRTRWFTTIKSLRAFIEREPS